MTQNYKGILAVVGGSLSVFWYGAFIFGFPGVMASDWQAALQVGRGEIGNIMFFVLAAVGVIMFFVGRWQDRVGIRAMVSLGAVICGMSVFFVAYASKLWMLYLWAFVVGGGSCFVYLPALTSVQKWYPARRGLVSGIVNFTFGIGGAIMAPVFRHLLETVGYFSMCLWLGTIALAVGLIAAQFTAPPSTQAAVAEAGGKSPAPFSGDVGRSLTVGQSLRTWSFRFLWLTWALQGAASIAMVTLSTAFGVSRGFGMESAIVILMAFNVTNGLGRLISGYLSDVLGRNSTMSFVFLAAGIAYLGLPHTHGLWMCALQASIIGFALGTLFAVSAPLAMDCFGIKHFGAIFGLVFTAYGFVAGPLGPSLSGYILDASNGNFAVVFGYLGCFCLVSSVLIRFVRPPRSRAAV